jgi:uncharacterized lipoprotein YmbA
MKPGFCLMRLAFVLLSAMLLSGCLLKTATVPARHFVLAPISADQPSPTPKEHFQVEIGFVKMPAYLLRDSMAVRNGANEIEYLENALWAERLDQSFQRALMADLCRSVAADNTHFAGADRKKESVSIFITVHQFDVDTSGHGTLVAQWRIAAPDGNELMSGHASLARTGRPPRGDPAAIAATMSELTAEFSNELARSLKGSAKAGTNLP